ncbi:DHS-like NAD/FAD-binding domain-containing protein [Amylocystis lapponica]|nr:DHS-like NAD/FAD-binding domain-containing protein [Amylocystis lapponica]
MLHTLDLNASQTDSATRRALSTLSLAVTKCKKIIVVTGAGISCSSGIPDFRSSDGLYALVKQQYPDVVLKGRDLFDASLFRNPTSTSVFYTFISELKQSIDSASPTPTHHFIKTLDSKRKLLRSYTQNIDGLEERAGLAGSSSQGVKTNGKGKAKIRVKDVRNVQLHGDIHRVRCTFCSAEFPSTAEHLKAFRTGIPPDCPECTSRSNDRVARAARALKVGTLRPAIVLYDEPHPLGDDIGSMQSADIARKPDMLIIMGTSLKVHGLKKLVKDFARTVVFVNKTAPGAEWDGIIDYHVVGETDRWVERVVEDWRKVRPADWEVQQKLAATGEEGAGAFAVPRSWKAEGAREHPAAGAGRAPAVHALPEPPSPGKRRQTGSHYGDVESSPSKKRDAGERKEHVVFEERGLLYAGDFDLGEVVLAKESRKRAASSATKTGAPKMKMEVVLDAQKPARRGTRVTSSSRI